MKHLKQNHDEWFGSTWGHFSDMVHNKDGAPVLFTDGEDPPLAFRYKAQWVVAELIHAMHLLQSCSEILRISFLKLMTALSSKIIPENIDWSLYSKEAPLVITIDKLPIEELAIGGMEIPLTEEAGLWANTTLRVELPDTIDTEVAEKISKQMEAIPIAPAPPEDHTPQELAEAAEMSPAIRRALREAGLRAIRRADGTWMIVRQRRKRQK